MVNFNWVKIGTSSGVAFVISIVICFSIEIFGGAVGGILGTIPNTVIPSSFAIMTDAATPDDSVSGVFAFSIGAFCSACAFLPVWLYVPPLITNRIPRLLKLIIVLIISIAAWGIVGVFFTWLQTQLPKWNIPLVVVAPILTVIVLIFGVYVCWVPEETPKGKKKVKPIVHIIRGLVVSCVIFISLIISGLGSSSYAGLFSAFPIILSVTMMSISLSQDDSVVRGAIGPLIVGNPSNSIYCFIASTLYAYGGIDPYLSCFIGFVVAVVCYSIPCYFFIQWRLRVKHKKQLAVHPINPIVVNENTKDFVLENTDDKIEENNTKQSISIQEEKPNNDETNTPIQIISPNINTTIETLEQDVSSTITDIDST